MAGEGLQGLAEIHVRRLIDPRLRNAIQEHWPSRCTIYQIAITLDAANQPIPTTPTLVLRPVECRIGPLILIRPSDAEIRDQKVTEVYAHREIKLNGYYPQITPHYMNASVTTAPSTTPEVWHIVGVEEDGNKFSTRIRVEVIKP